MAVPTFVAYTNTAGATQVEPTGTQEGDILIAVMNGASSPGGPSGWTKILSDRTASGETCNAWWIVRGSSAPSYTWTNSPDGGAVSAFRGSATSLHATGQSSAGSNISPSVDTTVDDCLIVLVYGDNEATSITAPSSTTLVTDGFYDSMATFTQASAGSTGAKTWQNTTSPLGAWTVALEPPSGNYADTLDLADSLSVEASIPIADTASLTDSFSVSQLVSFSDTITLADSLSKEVFQLRHDLKVEVETSTDTWEDVSDYVVAETESVGTFGRPTRFDDIAASTWTLNVRNDDGKFTPPNVSKGQRIRVGIIYAGQEYRRFFGRITDMTMPSFRSVEDAQMTISAADIMSDLARKTLHSPFVEESRRQARQSGGGVDVFAFPASQQVKASGSVSVADTSFENQGIIFPGGTTLGTVSVTAASSGGGQIRSSGADSDGGVLSEGQLDFEVGDDGQGKDAHPILAVRPQVGFQQVELFFKIPEDSLPPIYADDTHTVVAGENWYDMSAIYGNTFDQLRKLNSDLPSLGSLAVDQVVNLASTTLNSEWVIADFWSGSTELFRICIADQDSHSVIIARHTNGGASYITESSAEIATGKWHKLTIYKPDTDDTVRFNIDDSPGAGTLSSLNADLTEVDLVYIGGRASPSDPSGQQVQCPPMSIGGLAFQSNRVGVWYWYCLGAPPANITAAERLLELAQYAYPIDVATGLSWDSSLTRPFDVKVVRTDITNRTILDCAQELARTVGGYLWADPDDGTLILRKGATPPTDYFNVDLEFDADVSNPLEWRDSIDNQPTRITAICPAGRITSINTAAEAAGQYKDGEIETCASTIAMAKGVADRYVANQSVLRLTNLQVDLVHSGNRLHGQLLPTFLPTERVVRATNAPLAVLGYNTIDAVIESWTETYTIDSAVFAFETTPIATSISTPPLASFTVTSSTGTQDGVTITAPQPSGLSNGDLMLAILTVDDTGALADMTALAEWTEQGSGGSSDAGYGKIWTKTATSSEATSYDFTVAESTGTAILAQDDFTGSDDASLSGSLWSNGEVTTGAAATIQSNTARLDPGTLTGYSGRISVISSVGSVADVGIVFSFRLANNDCYPSVMLRGDSGGLGSHGYNLRVFTETQGYVVYSIVESYSATDLDAVDMSVSAGTWYRARFQAVGSEIKSKVWLASQAEPSLWDVEVTDTSLPSAGYVFLGAPGGNVAGSYVYYDDVIIYDPTATGGETAVPEAKLTLVRVSGADTSDPFVIDPTWADDATATDEHDAPTVSPAEEGLLVAHWHILTQGA